MKASLIVELDEAELACRIMEAVFEMKRPKGTTAAAELDLLPEDMRLAFRRAAVIAMLYLEECINAGSRPS